MLCRTLQRGLLQHSRHCSLLLRHTTSTSTSNTALLQHQRCYQSRASSSSRLVLAQQRCRQQQQHHLPSTPVATSTSPTAASASARMASTTAAAAAAAVSPAGVQMLAAQQDRYDGIIIDHSQLPSDPQAFKEAVQESLKVWSQQGKRGVWLKVPREHSQLIPVAVEAAGFAFHHAEQDYVMMTKWLPTDAPNTLPPNASHQVGVGAIVVNEQQQVLVVQEANGPLRGQGVWKMPTGLVHAGEDLIEAVEREVFEETGVEVKFDCVIAVRQAHGFAFGKSDLFFCCGCRPVNSGAMELKKCEREIAALSWISFEEYMAQPFFANLPLAYHTMMTSCQDWAAGRYTGMQGHVFDGTAARPRRDLLLWSAASAEAAERGNGGSAAAVATDGDAAAGGSDGSNGKTASAL